MEAPQKIVLPGEVISIHTVRLTARVAGKSGVLEKQLTWSDPSPDELRKPRPRKYRLKAKNVLIKSMRKDSLINTNSYLRDSKRREALLVKTVASSTAIEGVHLDWDDLEKSLPISNKNIRFYVSAKSSESRR